MTSNRDRCRGVPDHEARSPMPRAEARRCWGEDARPDSRDCDHRNGGRDSGNRRGRSSFRPQGTGCPDRARPRAGATPDRRRPTGVRRRQRQGPTGRGRDRIDAESDPIRHPSGESRSRATAGRSGVGVRQHGPVGRSPLRGEPERRVCEGRVRGRDERRHGAHDRPPSHRRERLAVPNVRRSICKRRRTRRPPTRRRRRPARRVRRRASSIPSSPRSPVSSSRPCPSSRRHRPRPPPRPFGPHRPRRVPQRQRQHRRPRLRAGPSSSTTQTAPAATSAAGQGTVAPASSGDPVLPPFLQCVLRVESGGNYAAVSPGGTYMGGFQFSQPTWNEAAQLAGMPQLVNVPPNQATPAEQDDLAIALYQADGQQPWNDSCRGG